MDELLPFLIPMTAFDSAFDVTDSTTPTIRFYTVPQCISIKIGTMDRARPN